jgi:BlaI family penicillinase repressor
MEWEVMKVLWERSPLPASEIGAAPSIKAWHPQTVKTLLGRLVRKGAIGFRKQGRAYMYLPLVSEPDCVTATSESFLRRVFGGSLMPMIAHFVEHRKLSAKEIEELKRLINQQRK